MSRLKNLYTYLITNRLPEVDSWLQSYQRFTTAVATISKALNEDHDLDLKSEEIYADTYFKDKSNPSEFFLEQLLYDWHNGVASRGQSVLSKDLFIKFINDSDFTNALTELIKTTDADTVEQFSDAWEQTRIKHGADRRPLLINRTMAACTTDVSSTVNEPDFETVYHWLKKENLLAEHPKANANWYEKNVHLMKSLAEEFGEKVEEEGSSKELLSIFVWELFQNIANPFSLKKQLIRYGAPGTGKTYTALKNTELLFDIWNEEFESPFKKEEHSEIIQFHPSFGYEDFMEGLRPALNPEGVPQLVLQNGVFKRACIRAAAWEIDVFNIPDKGPSLTKNWKNLTLQDLQPYQDYLKGQHWNYLHAQVQKDQLLENAIPPFFFIIDEINRAELSRVLGELMFSLEYRGVKGAISTQYSNLNTQETGMVSIAGSWKFFIPNNIFIIGTMNTIDRSVESFDLALRRRFRWERVEPNTNVLRYYLRQHLNKANVTATKWEGLADDLESLNKEIRSNEQLLGADYEIGHAYLMNLSYPPSLSHSQVREKVWDDSISPLLEEYLRGSGQSDELMPKLKKSFRIS